MVLKGSSWMWVSVGCILLSEQVCVCVCVCVFAYINVCVSQLRIGMCGKRGLLAA